MALLPMGPPTTSSHPRTDQAGYYGGDTQETMFDEPTALATPETFETSYEPADDVSSEISFEPAEEFADEVPELISYQSGSGHTAIETLNEPALEPVRIPVSEPAIEPETAATEMAQATSPEHSEAVQETPQGVAKPAAESAYVSPTMLTANDFAALEERVMRAVTLVRSERQARIAAEERAATMEAQLHDFEAQIQQIEAQSPILERLVREVESLRIEREQVRQRVERLLGQLDALEL
jgi:hypothetical protein